MINKVLIVLIPLFLFSCFDSDTEKEDDDQHKTGILTPYWEISDQNIFSSCHTWAPSVDTGDF